MRAHSFVAAMVTFFALIAGSAVIAGMRGAEFGAVSQYMFGGGGGFLKGVMSWGWAILGLLGVAGAFVAFTAGEGDDDGAWHRRFPAVLPILFLALSFGVLWLTMGPKAAPAAKPIIVAEKETPAPAANLEEELAGGEDAFAELEPLEPESASESEPVELAALAESEVHREEPKVAEEIAPIAPLASAEETGLFWMYEYPRIVDGRVVSSREVDRALAAFLPMDDKDGKVAAMLCGKAWVAFTGSASEEGPADRNAMRAKARAELVAARAEAWLDAHPDCRRPVIVALDLGQHQATNVGDPGATAYQRQLLVISRARATPEESVSSAAAVEEMEKFYADDVMRSRLLGARNYRHQAAAFIP
jgi:hypothetical protein